MFLNEKRDFFLGISCDKIFCSLLCWDKLAEVIYNHSNLLPAHSIP